MRRDRPQKHVRFLIMGEHARRWEKKYEVERSGSGSREIRKAPKRIDEQLELTA